MQVSVCLRNMLDMSTTLRGDHMRVLFACPPNDNSILENYRAGLESTGPGVIVDIGRETFWRADWHYDIVHIHWPEHLLGESSPRGPAVRSLLSRLNWWRDHGASIVVTRHNRHPHASKAGSSGWYDEVYKRSHAVVHLGRSSADDFYEQYAGESWFDRLSTEVIPHPCYTDLPDTYTRAQARRILGLSDELNIVLVFGAIRNRVESKFLLSAFNHLSVAKKYLLVPTFRLFKNRYLNKIMGVCLPILRVAGDKSLGTGFVPRELVQVYLRASDVVLVPRVGPASLNSGVVPLALTFGRVVVGPNQGVIGETLLSTGNPTFASGDSREAAGKLREGIARSGTQQETANSEYARTSLAIPHVGRLHMGLYERLLKGA